MIIGLMKNKSFIKFVMVIMTLSPHIVRSDSGDLTKLLQGISVKTGQQVKFIEERYAFYLEQPIKTKGQLKAIPPDELVKTIQSHEPVDQHISGNRVVHYKSGVAIREISLLKQPALAAAVNTLRALLFGDAQYLYRTFEVDYENHASKWVLQLHPREALVKKYIKSITVTGENSKIKQYTVIEINGDYSRTYLYADK